MPPPPGSGAAVGNTEDAGADVWVGVGVCVGRIVVTPGVGATEAVADAVFVAVAGVRDEADVCGEPDADALPRLCEVLADAPDVREDPPDGDGVRVPWLADCPLVVGVGVKMDGTEEPEPPPVQAETVTASRTAPAAERPATRHAPGAAMGGVRRIFMNPPRMRVR